MLKALTALITDQLSLNKALEKTLDLLVAAESLEEISQQLLKARQSMQLPWLRMVVIVIETAWLTYYKTEVFDSLGKDDIWVYDDIGVIYPIRTP